MSDDLVAFLNARYDEHEQVAHAASKTVDTATGSHPHHWKTDATECCVITDADGVILETSGHQADHRTAIVRHAALHDPARVLAEVEAKREVVRLAERASDYHETFLNGFAAAMEGALRLFAVPYAAHPDYRQEWKP